MLVKVLISGVGYSLSVARSLAAPLFCAEIPRCLSLTRAAA